MIMTAKVDLKKILMILAAIAAAVLALVLLFGGDSTAQTAAPSLSGNDGRVAYLKALGWEVNETPEESSQVKIPEDGSEVFDRYNALQKGQGFDLSQYAGKKVMRYVYKVTNYPGSAEPVYATLLIHKNQVIGGDITDTAPGGKIRGLQKTAVGESTPTETVPVTTAAR